MNNTTNETTTRPRPPWLRALGNDDPPAGVTVDDKDYTCVTIFKHDAWAATALYRGDGGKIICKYGRCAPLLGLPMLWLGKRLVGHERTVMQRLADVPAVPPVCGPVIADGRPLPHAMARRFVEGETLLCTKEIGPQFFPMLEDLIRQVHARNVAYVDLNKPDNILVSEDGKPHLIDFQISFVLTRRWPGNGMLAQWLLKLLQDADWYHFAKHVRRHRAQDLDTLKLPDPPWFIRLHRSLTVPLRQLRRRLLVKLRIRQGPGLASTEESQRYLQPENKSGDDR